MSYTQTADPRPAIYLPDALADAVPAVATALAAWRAASPLNLAATAAAVDAAVVANRGALRTAALAQLTTATAELAAARAAVRPAADKVTALHYAARALDL